MYITKQKHTDIENKLVATIGGRDRGRGEIRVWDKETQTTMYKINKQ